MNTYPLEEKCALVVTPELAAVILVQDAVENGGRDEIPRAILDALDAGLTPWQCTKDPGLFGILENEGFACVSDAFDVLQNEDDTSLVYCSEFTGQASVPAEFQAHGGRDAEYDDEYFACLSTLAEPGLFKQAYASPGDLAKEYADRLEGLVSPDVPVEKFIRDVSGTYVC